MGGGGALDVNIAKHVVADVAADVELLHAAVADWRGLGAVLSNASTARSRSPLDVVVHVQVEIIEILLQLLLVFAESTQVVHLRPTTLSKRACKNVRSEVKSTQPQRAAPEEPSTCAG